MICLAVTLSVTNTFLASAITSLLLAIAASIAALFSASRLFFRTASVAKTLVTSASEVTCSKTFLASWTGSTVSFVSSTFSAFSVAVVATGLTAVVAAVFSTCFPASSDSTTTVIKASTLACSASISACFAVSFARTAFAAVNTSFAVAIAVASAFFADAIFASNSTTFLVRAVLSTFLVSTTFSDALASDFSAVIVDSDSFVATGVVVATVASAPCTSAADTAPLPRNIIKPVAIATDAAPKLYFRMP